MRKVLVVGHFGYKNNQIDGQTIKTRMLYNALEVLNFNVKYIDVSEPTKLSNIINILLLFSFKEIIFLPGQNQLSLIFKVINAIKILTNAKLHYIVIGGWLYDYVKESSKRIDALKKFDSISCESKELVNNLKNINIESQVMLNFRKDSKICFKKRDKTEVKFFFFSRVIKEKGIFEAIQVVEKLIDLGYDCSLDIFGPNLLDNNDSIRFERRLSDKVRYKGVLDPEHDLHTTLTEYDILLFPTYYEGEGLPGTIIDAKFSATVPVVSNWKYNREFVADSDNGLIIELDDFVKNSVLKLERILANQNILDQLKYNSLSSSKMYSEDIVMNDWIKKNFR
ncbi:glycosyltransferase [Photobacterium leiognathi]|uniref:glycosyltransferase n=1 Tax=Photobacterium leiognathi TaxID=553611 RepID=UPI00273304E9|nr:glycosyltransferase [Photobacterium leiognathi]